MNKNAIIGETNSECEALSALVNPSEPEEMVYVVRLEILPDKIETLWFYPPQLVIKANDTTTTYLPADESQEQAIQYIRRSMQRELEIDRENGHDDSTLEEMENELFGMRLLTPQKDGTVDEMCMILAQSVIGNAKPAARPKKYKLPQIKRWKKNCLCMTADEFDDICAKLYGENVVTHYDMDGLWIETNEDKTVSDVDVQLIEDLTKYLGLKVTSVHIDDCDNVSVWIVYEEG